jgi:phage tail sheath gpL-like
MTVDASAIASTTAIGVEYKDFRSGSGQFLPQRLAVFAQGASASSFSTTKFTALSEADVGSKAGYGSPADLIAEQLFPANGDGVGTIPVDFYLLADDGSGVAAAGAYTPSGSTMTAQGTYAARIGGRLSGQFVVPKGAISITNVCGLIGDVVNADIRMPVTIGYTYGSVTAGALVGTGNGTLTALAVHAGSAPRPGIYTLTLVTVVANGGVWSLTDPLGTVITSTITQTPAPGGATVFSNQGGLDFTITDGTTDFGLGATFAITVPATAVLPKAKWKGLTGNDIVLEIVGPAGVAGDFTIGLTFAITAMVNGAVNPSLTAALAQVGSAWETIGLNAGGINDSTGLDAISTFGEGRWGDLVHKAFVCFVGNTAATLAAATAVCSLRSTDRVNGQLVAPGSVNLPFVVAARQLARILPVANNNPAKAYNGLKATGLIAGTDGQQWDYPTRDAALKLGSSTAGVVDGVVALGDIVTFYHPTGDANPAYRYLVTIVKLQQVQYRFEQTFGAPAWAGAPLIPDGQPTVNPDAKTPSMAKTEVGAILDGLGLDAIISDPTAAKKATTVVINSTNPNRLDITPPVQLSGFTGIKAINLRFGFFFGAAAA